MRKCCCCVSVHVGAAILGSIGLMICCLELVFSIPFIFDFDIDVFNPIKANKDIFFQTIEDEFENLKKQDVNKTVDWSYIDAGLEHAKIYLWSTFIGGICFINAF